MFGKAFFENLLGKKDEHPEVTRVDSPKLVKERKSRDFDTSSVRSPRTTRRTGKQGSSSNFFEDSAANSINRYQIENLDFAKGAYGKVSIAFDKISKEKVVIKQIPKTTPIRMIQNEVRAGQLVGDQHPNIARFHKYFEFVDHHSLIFSLIDGIDLFSHLEQVGFAPQSEDIARGLISNIVSALEHAHSRGVAHRDIKLENILLDKSGQAIVIDFGLCAFIEPNKKLRDWCGSDNYLAPQIVRRTPYDGYKADVFSCGVVLFAMLFGVFPFDNLRVNGRHSNDPSRPLPKLRVRFPSDVKVSSEAKMLVLQMLEDDEDERISMSDILKHEWIVGSRNEGPVSMESVVA